MLINETKIKEIIRLLITERNEQLVDQHNYLISLIKQYNATTSNKTKIRANLSRIIRNKTLQLGYSIGSNGNNIVVMNNDKPIKTIAVRRPQEEINSHKVLVEYPEDFQNFINKLFNTGGLTVHGLDINANPSQAQNNIIQGKKTVASNNALDSLERMFNDKIIRIKSTRHSQSERIPIDEYFKMFEDNRFENDEDYDMAFKQMVGENKNIKNENIMKLNKTKLQETVEKIVSGLLKEEITNSWNDLIEIRDNSRREYEPSISDHASMLLRQLNTAGGSHMMKNEVESFIDDNKKYLNNQINAGFSGNVKIGTKVAKDNMVAHVTDINSDGTVDLYIDTVNGRPSDEWYDGEYDMNLGHRIIGENGWELIESVIDESTYSFKSDDPQLQQKTQKLQSDSALFNKDEDEIKIDTTTESIMTGSQFMKMVNEAKAIRDKNGDYIKAIKKADRESEYDEKGPGWTAKQKVHKNDKKYDRKSFKKSEIIEMFKENKI